MELVALFANDEAIDPLAHHLTERGAVVVRAPNGDLAEHLAAPLSASAPPRPASLTASTPPRPASDSFDLVVFACTGDADANDAICRSIRAASPDVTLAIAGPLPARATAAVARVLDAGADAHLVTSLGMPLIEAQLVALVRAAIARAADRRSPERLENEAFRRLAEHAFDFCFRGRFTPTQTMALEWVTPAFYAFSGLTPADIAASYPLRRLIHPGDLPLGAAWIRGLRGGAPQTCELRFLSRHGEERWVRMSAEPIRDRAGGAPSAVLGVLKDITVEVRATADLEHRAAGLEEIIERSPLAIVAVDYAGTVTRWNPAAERLFGWTAEEAVGKPHPMFPEAERASFQVMIENAFCGNLEPMVETQQARRDGEVLALSTARAVLRDAHGAPTGVVAMTADVTARKQLEDRLRAADCLATAGRMAAAIGHEINNPLTYVLTNMNLVLERLTGEGSPPEPDAEAIEMLREARDGAERMRRIVLDLQRLSAEAAAEGRADRVDPAAAPPSPRPDAVEEDRPRGRLLIVDDEAQVARAIARLLREHEVTIADSGQAALNLIESEGPFDAILCDLMMPGLTGMDVHERIHHEKPGLEHRVIFMTGGVFTDRAAAFLARVPNPRLEKPFDPGAVKRAVGAMIRR